ncbi:GxxExxY protein [Thioalkalivibrio sp. ALJ1]|uniref:GxxExxY protein n=1 Tax=Thioalkalivibrio sp. ALJ1 TaxID=1158144 RepID=UPI00056F20D7|nr:GxxExxY protein [Thioalkalivibrio sp. ALJ1]
MEFDPISREVIGAAIEVHRELGPGLMESVYERCLAHELRQRGIECETQVPMPVAYKGETIEAGYRIDLLVRQCLMVELKSVDAINGLHKAQLLTYMKLARVDTGLLINFNAPVLKDGIRRLERRVSPTGL